MPKVSIIAGKQEFFNQVNPDSDRKERVGRLKSMISEMRNEAVRFRMMADEAACMLEELETGKPRPTPPPIRDWAFVKDWGKNRNNEKKLD